MAVSRTPLDLARSPRRAVPAGPRTARSSRRGAAALGRRSSADRAAGSGSWAFSDVRCTTSCFIWLVLPVVCGDRQAPVADRRRVPGPVRDHQPAGLPGARQPEPAGQHAADPDPRHHGGAAVSAACSATVISCSSPPPRIQGLREIRYVAGHRRAGRAILQETMQRAGLRATASTETTGRRTTRGRAAGRARDRRHRLPSTRSRRRPGSGRTTGGRCRGCGRSPR